jgi:hypothetical protein
LLGMPGRHRVRECWHSVTPAGTLSGHLEPRV